MRLVNKPIEMIAFHSKNGMPSPVRFKIAEGDNAVVIKVDRVIFSHLEKIEKKNYVLFDCESVIDGFEKRYELKFDQENFRWILNRM